MGTSKRLKGGRIIARRYNFRVALTKKTGERSITEYDPRAI